MLYWWSTSRLPSLPPWGMSAAQCEHGDKIPELNIIHMTTSDWCYYYLVVVNALLYFSVMIVHE